MPVAILRPATALPVALALALLALAIPRAGAALAELYAGKVGDFVGVELYGSPEEAVRAASILEGADYRYGDAWARVRAGNLRLFLAYIMSPSGDRRELSEAAADLSSGLARAPAVDAMGWAGLANARLALGDRAGAVRAFDLSLRLAAFEPQLALWRSQLGVSLMPDLNPQQRAEWMHQVETAWRFDGAALVARARRDGAAQALFSLALASQPSVLRQYEALVSPPP